LVAVEGEMVKCAAVQTLCINDASEAPIVVDLHVAVVSPGPLALERVLKLKKFKSNLRREPVQLLTLWWWMYPIIHDSVEVMRTADMLEVTLGPEK
jgi:hypothetical protein